MKEAYHMKNVYFFQKLLFFLLFAPFLELPCEELQEKEKTEQIDLEYSYDAESAVLSFKSINHREDEQTLQNISKIDFLLHQSAEAICEYDLNGNLVEMKVGNEILSYQYDLQGRLMRLENPFNESILYFYDSGNRCIEKNYSVWVEEESKWKLSYADFFCYRNVDEEAVLAEQLKNEEKLDWEFFSPEFLIDSSFSLNEELFSPYSLSIWDYCRKTLFSCFNQLQATVLEAKERWSAELRTSPSFNKSIEKIARTFFGDPTYLLMGHSVEKPRVSVYGHGEIHDKVRVSFINGILNNNESIFQSLDLLSKSHGGENIHYVFRPTQGWTWDLSFAFMVKIAFSIGFRSAHAHSLAQLWKRLIGEMGGVAGGGVIIHYAHSLGGSETDRACELLTPLEQRMIRVRTFGSATFVRNLGFQEVKNYVSVNDGISRVSAFLEPIGRIRAFFDQKSNVYYHGSFSFLPTDHLLCGSTYTPLIEKEGEHFLKEFRDFKDQTSL